MRITAAILRYRIERRFLMKRMPLVLLSSLLLPIILFSQAGCSGRAPESFSLQNGSAVVTKVDPNPNSSVFGDNSGSYKVVVVQLTVTPSDGEPLDSSTVYQELSENSFLESGTGSHYSGTVTSSSSESNSTDGVYVYYFNISYVIEKSVDPFSMIFCYGDNRTRLSFFA